LPIISELINNSHINMEEPPKHPAVAALFAELLAATNLNAAGLAKKLDITPQAVSNYVVGRNEPGRKMMAAIIKAFPAINAVWLATGEGEPFPNGVHNEKAEPAYKTNLRQAAALIDKIAAPSTPVAAEPEPARFTTQRETVAEAENILLRERIADKDVIIEMLRAELGKSNDSPDAAGSFPTSPRKPISGFMTDAQRAEIAEAFNEVIEEEMSEGSAVVVRR
jgi:plasmid maintenance system antidote protein VapI